MHPGVLRGPAGVTAGPLAIIFERSRQTLEVSEDWKTANVTPDFNKGRNKDWQSDRSVILTLISAKAME